ncbi:hypothetical protein ACFPPA_07660 [Rhodanobacter ginsengisoli]|uniref:Uncharacterized protein n=1 Tax=Rhodanobacter ginsengisoli TaxID=418646 RepID=A0ABW0QLK5_9GAMM
MNPLAESMAANALLAWILSLAVGGPGLIGAIGISRILSQARDFSDLLAGYTGAAAWLVPCIGVTEYLRDSTTRGAGNPSPEPPP